MGAKIAASGYIKDLKSEFAQGIKTQVKRGKPSRTTINFGEW
jgi:hypothetical protein